MAAPSPQDVLNDISGAFGIDPGSTQPLAKRWTAIAIFAASSAVAKVAAILYGKNWSQAQVLASPDIGTYMRDYALFVALSRGGPPKDFPAESLKALNCLEMVNDYAEVTDPNGNPIPPDGTSVVGAILSGRSNAAAEVEQNIVRRNLGYGRGYGSGYYGGGPYG